jgi:DNA repair exonuclease SbcCD ATPase subunit
MSRPIPRSPSKAKPTESRNSLYETSGRIKKLEHDLDEARTALPKLKFWEEGFGSRGIQNLLLDDVRSLLGKFTQQYLQYFSGGVLGVEYPLSDKGFEIKIVSRDNETTVDTLSRGEIGRANIAVLLALRKTILFLNKCKLDFVILDDVVSDVDEAGEEALIELSNSLAKDVTNVFVTLPKKFDSIKPSQIISVVKEGGRSRVVC